MLRYPYSVVVFGLAIVGLSVAIAWLPGVWAVLRQAWRGWRVRCECRPMAEQKIAAWTDPSLAPPHTRYHGDPKRHFSGPAADMHTVQRPRAGRQLDDLRIEDR